MATSNNNSISAVRNVWVTFDGGNRVILQDVSLDVAPNEILAILGPSGCGKSTLVRVMVGLIRPTRGEVLAHGKPLEGLHPGIALVFQNFGLFPWLTVRQNVEMALAGLDVPPDEAHDRVERCIDTVGLGGHLDAFPKELSGGMKQRVGIARAMARAPSSCAWTSRSARSTSSRPKVCGARSTTCGSAATAAPGRSPPPSSLKGIVMITHLIEEAVFLADRIVIMGTMPGHIRQILPNTLPHPRDYQSVEFLKIVQQIHGIIVSEHMPDEPATAVPAGQATTMEPIPPVELGQVIGLLEIVQDHRGRVDVFTLERLTDVEFGHTLALVMAGEMLDFLDTPKEMVILTDLGRRFLQQDVPGRQAILREQLLKLDLFKFIVKRLEVRPEKQLPKEIVEEDLVMRMLTRDIEPLFDTIVAWGRSGELFGYAPTTETLYLGEPQG